MTTTTPSDLAEVIHLRWRPVIAFPARLRAFRKDYGKLISRPGITQVAFAEVLGVNPNTYKQWEGGHSKPADLIAFAKHAFETTGCDPAWLLDVADAGPDGQGGLPGQSFPWSADRARKTPTRHLAAVA